MRFLKKLALFPGAILLACLAAGVFGVVHNQISYTIAPEYFHGFKFIQFRFPEALQTRVGASYIGWLASWWMGLLLAPLVFLTCLPAPRVRGVLRVFCEAVVLVIVTALLIGLGGALVQWMVEDPTALPDLPGWMDIREPLRFNRAGAMHNASYAGAALGALAAIVFALVRGIRLRRAEKVANGL